MKEKSKQLQTFILSLMMLIMGAAGAFGDTQTIKVGTVSSGDFTYSNLGAYSYDNNYWAKKNGSEVISLTNGGSFTFANSTGATITGITVKGVADNNNNQTSTVTITDNSSHSVTTGSTTWKNRKNTEPTSVTITTGIGSLNSAANSTYTVSNSGYNLGVQIEITYSGGATKHSVTYNLNGGTGTAPTQADVAEGETFLVAGSSGFSKSGYAFTQWNDGTRDYSPGDTYTMGGGAVTLTAQWAATHTITIDRNDGTSGDESVTATEGFALPEFTEATRDGYTLTGYFTSASGGTKVINDDGTLVRSTSYADGDGLWTSTSNLTVYAQWSLNPPTFSPASGGSLTAGEWVTISGIAGSYFKADWGDAAWSEEELKGHDPHTFNSSGVFRATSSGTGTRVLSAIAYDGTQYSELVTATYTVSSGPATITASPASVTVTGTASQNVTLSSNNTGGAYSITTNPNADIASATIVGNTLTITGKAAGNTSVTVTQAAYDNFEATTKTIDITVLGAGSSVTVLEAYGSSVSAGGTFTGKTDVTSVEFGQNQDYSSSIVSSHSANTSSTVYNTSATNIITLTLNSTSASRIVVGGVSSGTSARSLSSIEVSTNSGSTWETLSSSTYSVSNAIAGSSVNQSTISGLAIAQNSMVRLTYSGNVKFYYFEITPYSAPAKSSDANMKTVVVNGHTLTADGTTYTYNIGTEQYASGATIPVTVTPNDANATINSYTGTQNIDVTIGTPLSITVTAEDEKTTKTYTVNVNSVAKTSLDGNTFAVAAGTYYYEGQQFATTGDNITASISTKFGYERIGTNQRENYANSDYSYNLVTDTAKTQMANGTVPESGVYYKFEAAAAGYLQVGMWLGAGKTLHVVDNTGTAVAYTYKFMSDATTEQPMTSKQLATAATGYIEFPVADGKTYYVYASGSKLSLMGFSYNSKSSDATARFTLKGEAVNFTDNAYRYVATSEAVGDPLAVVITPAARASVTNATNAIENSTNNYTITVPTAGTSVSSIFTITAEDGTTNQYTIRVNKPAASSTVFDMVIGSIDSDVKIGAGETVDITTTSPSYASTLKGGTAQAGLTNDATKSYIVISNRDYVNFGTNVAYLKVTLDSPLQAGDVIEFTSYGSSDKQFAITTEATRNTDNLTSNNKYTVTSTLDGESVIYLWRAEATSSYITRLWISRPTVTTDVTVKINNTTITRGSGTGKEADPYVYSYEIANSYPGATVPVAITTTGNISENITSVAAPAYGTPTEKTFSVSDGGSTTTYYKLRVSRAASSDCTITGATASDATAGAVTASVSGTAITVLVPYGDGTSATTVTLGVTLPTGATAAWASSSNTVSLPGAPDSKVTKQVIVTAQDETTQKTYTFTVTRGENTEGYLLVVGDGQEYELEKNKAGTRGSTHYDAGDDFFTATDNFVSVEQLSKKNYLNASGSTRSLQLVVKGALSFEVLTYVGNVSRTYTVKVDFDNDGTYDYTKNKISATETGVISSGLIKATNTGSILSNAIKIQVSGDGSGSVYPYKVIFYKTTPAKKEVTMSYSAAEWNGTGAQPTLTAEDEDGTDVSSSVTYESDDTKVATVAADGTVTILPTANGNAMIYATYAGDNTHEAASTYFTVVKQQGASYKQTSETVNVGDHAYLYTNGATYGGGRSVPGGNDVLVTATFGGWQYGEYKKSGSSTITDSWNATASGKVTDGIDGYDYNKNGAQDACDEAKGTESYYGGTRYGWFHPAETDDEGKVVAYPFTLPCRGSYMTFEPTVNGTLTLYLNQNGAWNTYNNDGTDDDGYAYKKSNIIHGEFRKHAFYITDHRGVSISTYTDFATNVKGKVTAKNYRTGANYYCSVDAFGNATDESENNIATWNEFKNYYTSKERVAIAAAWSSGVKGAQKIVKLDNGSFFLTHRASTKYTFYVAAGQTYYVFSNFSKLGFMGMNFVPDSDNEVTGTLNLSENVAYNPATLKKASGNISVPQYSEITLDRTFTAGNWNTICLPFSMTEAEVKANFGEDTELLVMDHVDMVGTTAEVHLKYHEIQSILPGYPYLIKPSQACNGIVVANKVIDPAETLFTIEDGNYTAKGIDGFCTPNPAYGNNRSYLLKEGDIFLSGNKLWVSKGASYLKGYRSYFDIAEGAPVPNAVEFSYSSYEDDQETSISILEFTDEALEAFGIKRNYDGVYNLNGQKVADTTENLPAGMYIVNGKKMYVK